MKKNILVMIFLIVATLLFADNYSRENDIVTDHDRGLQWQDQPYTQAEKDAYNETEASKQTGKAKKWINAAAYCDNLDLDGGGWRLATIDELNSTVDESRSDPAINPIFQNAESLGYWSGTTYPDNTDQAWGIGFNSGGWHHCNKDGRIKFIRCVREAVTTKMVKIMPLGDSITYGSHNGTADSTVDVAYRKHLWETLTDAGYIFNFVGSMQAGTDYAPPFDPDNEGHPGDTAEGIAVDVYDYLTNNPADIALLHIGTNVLSTDPGDVAHALDEIDRYETDSGNHVSVILARIINRATDSDDTNETERNMTSEFNINLEEMARQRIANGDDIVIVDMENGAGIDYSVNTDMIDYLHLKDEGYAKMASMWYTALTAAIPTHLWSFDEADDATTFLDTYRENAGTCTGSGCPTAVSGKIEGAQLFNGSDTEVNIADDNTSDWNGNESFTIEFWIKPNRTDGADQVVIGRENDAQDSYLWWVGIDGSTGHLVFHLRDSNGIDNSIDGGSITNNTWYHVACVHDAASNKDYIYINDEDPVDEDQTYTGNFAGTTPINIGYLSYQGSNQFHLDGTVDELTLYNGRVNADQIKLHYQKGSSNNPPTLSITTTPVTAARVGVLYHYDVNSSNDPSAVFTYTANPDISWINIDTDTGIIEGTPPSHDTVGNIAMAVEATDGTANATQDYTLKVRDPESLPGGMVHYWKLDENDTSDTRIYLDSYAGADGTCSGDDCPTPRQGKVDGAQSFNGSNKIDVTDTSSFNWTADSNFTIEYWVRIDDDVDIDQYNMVVIGRDGGDSDSYTWWAGIEKETGKAIFSLRSDDATKYTVTSRDTVVGNTGIHAGGHYITIVRDGSANELRLYVDGNETNVTTGASYPSDFSDSSESAVNIGYLNYNGNPGFFLNNGTSGIDDIAVFNEALSIEDIEEHFENSQNHHSFEILEDTTPPVITLNGDDPQKIDENDSYTELNATAEDNIDGDVSANISIDSSEVNTSQIGDYNVTYSVTDTAGNTAVKTRTVKVIDATKPVITLEGNETVEVEKGDVYTDAGATASDNIDGDITASRNLYGNLQCQ